MKLCVLKTNPNAKPKQAKPRYKGITWIWCNEIFVLVIQCHHESPARLPVVVGGIPAAKYRERILIPRPTDP